LVLDSLPLQTVCLWETNSFDQIAMLAGHTGSVNCSRFHPTEQLLVSASGDRSLCVWRLSECCDQGDTEYRWGQVTHSVGSSQHVMSPSARIWGHEDVVSGVDWMPSLSMIASSSWDKNVLLWDLQSTHSAPSRTLKGHDGPLTGVSASKNGLLLSCSRDCTARLWDCRENNALVHVLQGHSNTVTQSILSDDSLRAYTASDDKTIKVRALTHP
jgi:WD40 repeat protein